MVEGGKKHVTYCSQWNLKYSMSKVFNVILQPYLKKQAYKKEYIIFLLEVFFIKSAWQYVGQLDDIVVGVFALQLQKNPFGEWVTYREITSHR